ncbi:cytochrome P450 [Ensifer sp. P24N7]|uniref:cytochrome P450 n=1 Tax=Sinorhizobium sp. P24N7 TaxID=3348358 RepID=UPI0035F43179
MLSDPYRFISSRCRRYETDLFETRILLQKTICMTGPEAARLFYDANRFARHGAMPVAIQKTLLGEGGVQGLDGEAHRHRKQMFMSLMTPERIGRLSQLSAAEWEASIRRWGSNRDIVLYAELQELLTRAACSWAGVPLTEGDVKTRTREITVLFDRAASTGFGHLWSRLARKRTDRWLTDVVGRIRNGQLRPPQDSPAHVISWHRDWNGELLPPHVAAVELMNVIRPTVAVSVYIVFLAHALHAHPEFRERLSTERDAHVEAFVQEVRRYYPFFPAVAARVRQTFEWNGYPLAAGRRVILDLYGTNHDARSWERPNDFDPERFNRGEAGTFNFVPQGGGDHHNGHRCPGEWIAVELMKLAADILCHRIEYRVAEQDLRIDWSRLPALPRSRFIIGEVRAV